MLYVIASSCVVYATVNAHEICAQSAAAPLPSFDVVLIKKSRSDELPRGPSFQPGRFTGRSQTINLVIALAYNVYPLKILGAPGWVNSERYDIQAKESDADA